MNGYPSAFQFGNKTEYNAHNATAEDNRYQHYTAQGFSYQLNYPEQQNSGDSRNVNAYTRSCDKGEKGESGIKDDSHAFRAGVIPSFTPAPRFTLDQFNQIMKRLNKENAVERAAHMAGCYAGKTNEEAEL